MLCTILNIFSALDTGQKGLRCDAIAQVSTLQQQLAQARAGAMEVRGGDGPGGAGLRAVGAGEGCVLAVETGAHALASHRSPFCPVSM